jgi:hypothetical protein
MKEFYKSLHETARAANLKILPDDKCCQLLAWLLHFGGGQEEVTFNTKLNVDIGEAQNRLNLYGGELCNIELLPMLKIYSMDAEKYIAGKIPKSVWMQEIETTYNVKCE